MPYGTKWETAKFVATRPFANSLNKVYANIAICSVAPLSHSHKCSREIIEYECLELSFAISKTIKNGDIVIMGTP